MTWLLALTATVLTIALVDVLLRLTGGRFVAIRRATPKKETVR